MANLGLLGFVPNWVSTWLTPVWILFIGIAIGMALCAIYWLIAAAISRIPGVGTLSENPSASKAVTGVIFVVLMILSVVFIIGPGWSQWQADPDTSAVGTLITLLIVLTPCAFGAAAASVHLFSKRTVSETPQAVREGALWPLFIKGCVVTVLAFLGYFVCHDPAAMVRSLVRLPSIEDRQEAIKLPGFSDNEDEFAEPKQVAVDIESLSRSELAKIEFASNQRIEFATASEDTPSVRGRRVAAFEVSANQPYTWDLSKIQEKPFPEDSITKLYLRNYGLEEATVDLTLVLQPEQPQIALVVPTAIGVFAVFILYLLQRSALPRVSAIALSTFKSEVAQPLFPILMAAGMFFVILFIWIPYFTLGEDIKVLKDSSLTWIMFLCIIQAIWAASTSVSEEIEGRTALTVLSKPLTRRSFVIGKYLGILWTVALLFIFLGTVLLIVVAYKPIYDAREGAEEAATWTVCYFEMVRTVPGLVLAFMETMVLTAISVAISTRLPLLANFIISFSIYVLGHLTPLVVQTSDERFEIVRFFGQFIATVFPNLDNFNIQAAVAAGVAVPLEYMAWTLVYCMVYSLIAMFLALIMFEDRDLA